MGSGSSEVLCEKMGIKSKRKRVMYVVELGLVLCVIAYRVCSLWGGEHVVDVAGLVALGCDSWFALEIIMLVSTWWTPLEFRTSPQTLINNSGADELPLVDMFVTTADAVMEPAMVTVNTVVSLMAVEYPHHKLACYVSDDAHSPLLLYALNEAVPFTRLWIPFCKKYSIQLRAPFNYFQASPPPSSSPEFRLHWTQIKDEYEALSQRVHQASANPQFANTDKANHPTIVKVIWENKEKDPEGLPHLIYVCREKRPNYPHHYKAGAMNVLTRVSGLMTNAPYMLNVDCDMFANNPTIVLQAMCCFLGLKPQDCAFVQFSQAFYNNLKDDPFANQMIDGFELLGRAMAGIQGPLYIGTGCFHRRKLIYGFSIDNNDCICIHQDDRRSEEAMKERFGKSSEFVGKVVSGENENEFWRVEEAASGVAGCEYEHGTAWGNHVGWGYGSLTEDVLTGMRIHSRGWSSVSLMPDQPGFLGIAPGSGPATLVQRKRWTTGLLQVLLGPNSPILATMRANLSFRQALAYTWILDWGFRAIFHSCYALLPAYSIISNSTFLPKVNEPAMLIFVAQFMTHHLNAICSYIKLNQSVRAWWNNLRMLKIMSATCDLFGVVTYVLQQLGISDISFDLTQKDQSDDDAANAGRFTFDESPMFVPATTLLLVHLTALAMALFGRRSVNAGELLSSIWVVMCFWPFVRGLFAKGKYGIPLSTILKSAVFAFLFVQSCTHILI